MVPDSVDIPAWLPVGCAVQHAGRIGLGAIDQQSPEFPLGPGGEVGLHDERLDLTALRMVKTQLAGVQAKPCPGAAAVERVTEDGKAQIGGVYSDLMGAAGDRRRDDGSPTVGLIQDAEPCFGLVADFQDWAADVLWPRPFYAGEGDVLRAL